MQYLESIKQAGHTRLFPQLKSKRNNGYGKWFGRLVSSLGLTDPRLVIHSLRHGGISKLHSAGVPVNIAETLTGHTAGNVHKQYVHKN
jgi:integrase